MAFDLKRLVKKAYDQANPLDGGKTWKNPQPAVRPAPPASTAVRRPMNVQPALTVRQANTSRLNQSAPVRQPQVRPVQVAQPRPLNVGKTQVMPSIQARTGVKGYTPPTAMDRAKSVVNNTSDFGNAVTDRVGGGIIRGAVRLGAFAAEPLPGQQRQAAEKFVQKYMEAPKTRTGVGGYKRDSIGGKAGTVTGTVIKGGVDLVGMSKVGGATTKLVNSTNKVKNLRNAGTLGTIGANTAAYGAGGVAALNTMDVQQVGMGNDYRNTTARIPVKAGMSLYEKQTGRTPTYTPNKATGILLGAPQVDTYQTEGKALAQVAPGPLKGKTGVTTGLVAAADILPMATPFVGPAVRGGVNAAKNIPNAPQAAKDIINKKPNRNISDQELAAIQRVRQEQTGWGGSVARATDQDYAIFRQAQAKLGSTDPKAIDDLIGSRRQFDVKQSQRLMPAEKNYIRVGKDGSEQQIDNRLYHGSPDADKIRKEGFKAGVRPSDKAAPVFGDGVYMSTIKSAAEPYAKRGAFKSETGEVLEIDIPKDLRLKEVSVDDAFKPKLIEKLKKQGFDGVINDDIINVFDPKKVSLVGAKAKAPSNKRELAELDRKIAAFGNDRSGGYQSLVKRREELTGKADEAPKSLDDLFNDPMFDDIVNAPAKPPANAFQDTLPSKSRPKAIKDVLSKGGNPLYHDTTSKGVLGILDSGEIRASQAPFSQIAGQGKRVSTTRNFDNYSRYGNAPYRFVLDESKTGQKSIPDNREEFESIFKKSVSTKSVETLAIDITNPALIDDMNSGKLADVLAKAQEKGIKVEPFEGKILPNEAANAEIQALTRDRFNKEFGNQLAPAKPAAKEPIDDMWARYDSMPESPAKDKLLKELDTRMETDVYDDAVANGYDSAKGDFVDAPKTREDGLPNEFHRIDAEGGKPNLEALDRWNSGRSTGGWGTGLYVNLSKQQVRDNGGHKTVERIVKNALEKPFIVKGFDQTWDVNQFGRILARTDEKDLSQFEQFSELEEAAYKAGIKFDPELARQAIAKTEAEKAARDYDRVALADVDQPMNHYMKGLGYDGIINTKVDDSSAGSVIFRGTKAYDEAMKAFDDTDAASKYKLGEADGDAITKSELDDIIATNRKRFGDENVKLENPNDKNAVGSYRYDDDMIRLANGKADLDTFNHESVHKAIGQFLDDSDIESLYKDVAKISGGKNSLKNQYRKNGYEGATWRDAAEEEIANKFIDFMKNGGISTGKNIGNRAAELATKLNLPESVVRVFEKLADQIYKNFSGGKIAARDRLEDFYKRVDDGSFNGAQRRDTPYLQPTIGNKFQSFLDGPKQAEAKLRIDPAKADTAPTTKPTKQLSGEAVPALTPKQLESSSQANSTPILGTPIKAGAKKTAATQEAAQQSSAKAQVSDTSTVKLNTKNLDVSDEAKNRLEAETFKTVEKLTDKQVIDAAKAAGLDTKSYSIGDTRKKIAEQLNVRRSNVEVEQKILKAKQSGASVDEIAKLMRESAEIGRLSREQGTDIARQLSARRILADEMNTPFQRITALLDKAGVNPDVYAKRLASVDFDNGDDVVKAYRELVPARAEDWLDKYRYTNMLSSPITHMVNITSNITGIGGVAPVQKIFEGTLDAIRAGVTGKARTRYASEAGAYLKGAAKSLPEAKQRFADVMSGKVAMDIPDAQSLKNGKLAYGGVKGMLDTILTVIPKFLEASDQAGMTVTRAAERASFEKRMAKGVKIAGDLDGKIDDAATYRVFRQELGKEGQGPLLEMIDFIPQKVLEARNVKNPIVRNLAKFTLPFVTTPTNLFKQGIEYSPAGVLTVVGNADKTAQLAKATMGTATMGLVAGAFAANDAITFSEPSDAKQRDAFRAEGKQAYAVKIGDKWIAYNKLHPAIAFNFASVAAAKEALDKGSMTESEVDKFLGTAAGVVGFFRDQSYMKSLGDFSSNLQLKDEGDLKSAFASTASNYANQLAPFKSAVSWIGRQVDPTQRKTDRDASTPEQIYQNIVKDNPLLNKGVPARINPYTGEPLKNDNPTLNSFSPLRVTNDRGFGNTTSLNVDQREQLRDLPADQREAFRRGIVEDKFAKQQLTKEKNDIKEDETKVTKLSSGEYYAKVGDKYRTFESKEKADAAIAKKANGGDIAPTITPHSQKVLKEYNKLDEATRNKKIESEPDYEWKVAKSKLENDKAAGKLTKLQQQEREDQVAELEMKKGYSKEARELYGKSAENIERYLEKNGSDKLVEELLALDQLEVDKGFRKKRKLAGGTSSSTGGKRSGKKTAKGTGKGSGRKTGKGSRGGKGDTFDFGAALTSTNRFATSNQSALRSLVTKNRIKAKSRSR